MQEKWVIIKSYSNVTVLEYQLEHLDCGSQFLNLRYRSIKTQATQTICSLNVNLISNNLIPLFNDLLSKEKIHIRE